MTEVSFYHLEHLSLEHALPKLLEKAIAAGGRAVVLGGTETRVETLSSLLWTYDPNSWLPHGTVKDGCPEDQPIWLTTDQGNPNDSSFLLTLFIFRLAFNFTGLSLPIVT